MEFWGVEVKAGESVKVEASHEIVIHVSQAALGEVKNDNKNELVPIFLNVDDQKLVIGSLSPGKISQIAYDFVLDRNFELSHNWKNGSVYFCGYRSQIDDDCCGTDSELDSDSESDFGSDIPVIAKENGKPEPKNANAPAKKAKITTAEPTSDDDEDSDDDDSDDSESFDSEEELVNGIGSSGDDDSEDNDSEDDSSDEDTSEEMPKKVEHTKKRKAEEASKTLVPEKKAKLVTPQKTGENKKGGAHVATPFPSKKSKQSGGQTPRKSKN
ncbi:hypothetical protein ACHQM5_009863 [Ranunculus cassubicifolius]